MTKPWLVLSFVFGLALMLATPVLAGFQEGVDAYERGDYGPALKEFRPLGEQGGAAAQAYLGVLYQHGNGAPQDYVEAVKWYRLAADQGNKIGQSRLGVMYFLGQGVPEDYVLAYMWMNLGAVQGEASGVMLRDGVRSLMTREQIAEAQRLAREWKPKGRE